MLGPPATLLKGKNPVGINVALELGEEGFARWRG